MAGGRIRNADSGSANAGGAGNRARVLSQCWKAPREERAPPEAPGAAGYEKTRAPRQ